jgi:hypothetical protein
LMTGRASLMAGGISMDQIWGLMNNEWDCGIYLVPPWMSLLWIHWGWEVILITRVVIELYVMQWFSWVLMWHCPPVNLKNQQYKRRVIPIVAISRSEWVEQAERTEKGYRFAFPSRSERIKVLCHDKDIAQVVLDEAQLIFKVSTVPSFKIHGLHALIA